MDNVNFDGVFQAVKDHSKKGELTEAHQLLFNQFLALQNSILCEIDLSTLEGDTEFKIFQDPPAKALQKLSNLYDSGKYFQVVEAAYDLIKEYQKNVFVWNIFGSAAAQIGLFEIAISAFRKIIEINPDYPHAYNNLGTALIEKGSLPEAIDYLNEAIRLHPDFAEAYHSLGNAFFGQKCFDEAVTAYERAVEINPDFLEAQQNLNLLRSEDFKNDI